VECRALKLGEILKPMNHSTNEHDLLEGQRNTPNNVLPER
jgi:hypothetical protein